MPLTLVMQPSELVRKFFLGAALTESQPRVGADQILFEELWPSVVIVIKCKPRLDVFTREVPHHLVEAAELTPLVHVRAVFIGRTNYPALQLRWQTSQSLVLAKHFHPGSRQDKLQVRVRREEVYK